MNPVRTHPPTIYEVIDNIVCGCDGEDMALLTEEFTHRIDHGQLHCLPWRSVWLHRAWTDPVGDLLTPRDRELLVLVDTSPLRVDPGVAGRHLRRFGTSPAAAQACIERLMHAGHLPASSNLRLDVPAVDLEWIAHRAHSVGAVRYRVGLNLHADTAGPTYPAPFERTERLP